MAIRDRILAHVEDTEARKEWARREMMRLAEALPLADLLDDPSAVIAALLAVSTVRLSGPAAVQAKDSQDYVAQLGLMMLADSALGEIAERVELEFVEAAREALNVAGGSIIEQADQMAAQTSPQQARQALGRPVATAAIMASFVAIARSAGAAYIQEIDRSVADEALDALERREDVAPFFRPDAILYSWIAVMDGKTCDDVFDDSCAPRHGVEMTASDWSERGRPGSPILLCSIYAKGASYCRCMLARASKVSKSDLPKPIDAAEAIKAGKARANR